MRSWLERSFRNRIFLTVPLVVLAVLLLALGLGARPYFAARSAGELTVSISVDGETV